MITSAGNTRIPSWSTYQFSGEGSPACFMSDSIVSCEVVVANRQGFHARPANLFVQTAAKFKSRIAVIKGNERIDGKSILDLLTLGAQQGSCLRLEADGEDAGEAIEALAQLMRSGFGELEETQ